MESLRYRNECLTNENQLNRTNNLWTNLSEEVNKAMENAYRHQDQTRKSAFIEIEIQFGTFTPPKENQRHGKFRSQVSAIAFDRVMKAMRQSNPKQTSEQVIEDHIDGNERRGYNKTTGQTTYYDKVKVWSSYVFFDTNQKRMNTRISNYGRYFAEELNSRINISNEYTYRSPSKTFTPQTIRNKNRVSFIFEDIGKLDLTQATETSIDKYDETNPENLHHNKGSLQSYETTYEIELEINQNDFSKNNLKIQKFCEQIYKLIQDSEVPYTNSEKSNMYKYVSKILNINSGILRYSLLAEARDIKMDDMVYGGIVGNKDTKYVVTHKADGLRRLAVVMPNELWLFMPGLPDANLVYRREQNVSMDVMNKNGFILDGELLTQENRKDNIPTKYMYYIFDCLCSNNQNIRNTRDYLKRLESAHQFKKLYPETFHPMIEFKVKDTKLFSEVDEFFRVMRDMFDEQSRLEYNQDGFMFIPIQTEYNPYDCDSSFPPIYSRCLTQYPDICKWKPKNMRSIDFLVEIRQITPTEKKIILNALEVDPKSNQRKMRQFNGSKTHPLNDRIDIHHPILDTLLNKTIVEFYWDEDKGLLVPIRIRPDKVSPNRYFSALNIWKGIFSGIDPQTLRGESFQLMRAYHNKIKLDLYHQISPARNHRVLLDIGSGRGGDIKKWKDYELIFAVEPNETHIQELQERLQLSDIKDKVIIIHTGGEDYETITKTIQQKYGERVSTVSLMLSFSFFHGKFRDGLRRTIEQNLDENGEVLIFTIDGDEVYNLMESTKDKHIRILDADIKYESHSGKLWINIPSTIVSNQEEIPPKLSELFLEWDNFEAQDIKSADEQQFLNPDEKKFSQLFKSFKLKMKPRPPQHEKERLIPYGNFNGHNWYGITIEPSEYLFLSIILKAIQPEYQNCSLLSFRRDYEQKTWNEIQKYISEEEKKKYRSLKDENILELLSDIFELSILYIKDDHTKIYGKNPNRIIIYENQLMGSLDETGLMRTTF